MPNIVIAKIVADKIDKGRISAVYFPVPEMVLSRMGA